MTTTATLLVSLSSLSAFAAADPALTDPPDDALVATCSNASLKIMRTPTRAAVPQALRTAGNAVAGAYFDSNYRTFRPLRLRSDFYIRSAPSAQAQKIAIVRDQALNSKVFLTGRIIDDGRAWLEVIENGREAWISADALVDGRPPGLRVVLTEAKPQTLGEMFGGSKTPAVEPAPAPRPPVVHVPHPVVVAPSARPRPVAPSARPVVVSPPAPSRPVPPPVVARPAAPPVPVVVEAPPVVRRPTPPHPATPVATAPKPQGPLCVNSEKDFARTLRFQKAMPGDNPFTHWNGPFGASIDVNSDGSAILHHPIHGDIPLHLSLCLDATEHPYISINGSPMYLQGADFSQVMVTDPTSGSKFQFNQVVN